MFVCTTEVANVESERREGVGSSDLNERMTQHYDIVTNQPDLHAFPIPITLSRTKVRHRDSVPCLNDAYEQEQTGTESIVSP